MCVLRFGKSDASFSIHELAAPCPGRISNDASSMSLEEYAIERL
jgi:hypothetical protein